MTILKHCSHRTMNALHCMELVNDFSFLFLSRIYAGFMPQHYQHIVIYLNFSYYIGYILYFNCISVSYHSQLPPLFEFSCAVYCFSLFFVLFTQQPLYPPGAAADSPACPHNDSNRPISHWDTQKHHRVGLGSILSPFNQFTMRKYDRILILKTLCLRKVV